MKIFVAVLAFLLAGINAEQPGQISHELKNLPEYVLHLNAPVKIVPNPEEYKDVNALNENKTQAFNSNTNPNINHILLKLGIKNRINMMRKLIPDPYEFPKYSLYVNRGDRSFEANLRDVALRGLGNINVDNINVNNCGKKATIILRFPKVDVNCGNIDLDVTVFDSKLSVAKNGTVSVHNVVVVVDVDIKGNHDSVKNLETSVNFVGAVRSNLNVMLMGADISRAVNNFVEKIMPSIFHGNKYKLQEILRDVALRDFSGAL